MIQLVYDGSFSGFLTTVFDVYETKLKMVQIVSQQSYKPQFFAVDKIIVTDDQKAGRVWNGLKARISGKAATEITRTFLSEEKEVEKMLLSYIQYAFSRHQSIESDFTNEAVLYVTQTAKKVAREKHRMEAFVRFQLLQDNLYFAACQPDFNVLPLIERHFTQRFADQRWMIYDAKRKFGMYFNLHMVEWVEMDFHENISPVNPDIVFHAEEPLYQQLWKQYFSSVNIAARKNTRLHLQHMPKRYWKFLPEKKH